MFKLQILNSLFFFFFCLFIFLFLTPFFFFSGTEQSDFYKACLEIERLAVQQLPANALNIYIKCAQDVKRHIKYLGTLQPPRSVAVIYDSKQIYNYHCKIIIIYYSFY